VLWTEALLDEWEEVVTRDHWRTTASARSITDAIREFFADSEVQMADYSPLVSGMPGDDPDDHVHMAAAIAGGANTIVTSNLKDFPAEALAKRGLEVLDTDTYLCRLVEQFPGEVAATLIRLAAWQPRMRSGPPRCEPDPIVRGGRRRGGWIPDHTRCHLESADRCATRSAPSYPGDRATCRLRYT
jgi:predicted nucleic acid-binding protein